MKIFIKCEYLFQSCAMSAQTRRAKLFALCAQSRCAMNALPRYEVVLVVKCD